MLIKNKDAITFINEIRKHKTTIIKMKTKNLFLGIAIVIGFSCATIAQSVPSYVPANGLNAWYSFTGNANDDSGSGNNGTVNGVTLSTGKQSIVNTAYAFNGINNTIDLANPFLGGTQVTAFTFHGLVYFNSTSNSPNIWGKTYNWGEVNFSVSNQNEVRFIWANSITGNKYSSIFSQINALLPNQWYDIVVTFQNSIGQIYLNGTPITTNMIWNAQGGSVLSTTQIESSCNFAQHNGSSKIGVRNQGGSLVGYLDGKIDEFGIWNRALSPAEITTLYNGTNPSACLPSYVPTTGLVGFWPFCGNANDESGNANNGTVNGATLTTDRNGIANSAYYFSSTNCATRIDAQVNTTSIQTGLTISTWISKTAEGCQSPRIFEFRVAADGPGEAQWGWPFPNSANMIYMGSTTSTGFVCSYGVPIVSNNIWTHLVYTNDGTTGKFYQDGVLKGTVSSTGNPILSGNAAFGRMNHPANDAFNGKLDDIGIWNRALTSCEVQQLYSGLIGAAPSLTTVAISNSICSGQSTTLTASGAGTYTWVPGNLSTATVNVNPNTSTTYTVTGSNGGCTSTKTITINVNATPTVSAISNPLLLCGNTNATLTAAGATTYTWMPGNIINNSITTSSLTTYTVTGKTGNCSSSKTITVQGTNILLQPQSQTVNTGTNVIMTAKSTNSLATYQWQTDIGFGFQNISNAGQYSGVTTSTLTVNNLALINNNSLYRCIISAPSCTLTSNTSTLTVTDANSINELYLLQNITIYPNPASSEITINSSVKFTTIKIVNTIGQTILTKESSSSVLVSTLSNGIYFIELYDEEGKLLKIGKFIKE